MKQQWPADDVIVQLFAMHRKNPGGGFIQYMYHIEGGSKASPEALAKATMELMEGRVALAVDVVNGVIFMTTAILEYAVVQGMEQDFCSMGFRAVFDLLKQGSGVPIRVIEVKKNGSIKYLD